MDPKLNTHKSLIISKQFFCYSYLDSDILRESFEYLDWDQDGKLTFEDIENRIIIDQVPYTINKPLFEKSTKLFEEQYLTL